MGVKSTLVEGLFGDRKVVRGVSLQLVLSVHGT